ncbi:MAG: DMT family transporter [Alphaproteobacteria bacterium]
MAPAHLAFMVLICLVWGFNFVAAKVGLGELPPFLFTALRFVLVALLLLPFLRLHPGRMGQIARIAVFAGSLHFGLVFLGLEIADASVVAVVAQLNVPFATLLSIFWLGESVGWRRWAGIAVAFSGAALIGIDPNVIPDLGGILLVALGALSIAAAMILMRRLAGGVKALELQAWIAMLSWPPLLLMSLTVEAGQWRAIMQAPPVAWGALAYTAVGASIIGHAGFYWLLQRYEVSVTSPLTLMAPIFGMFFGITVLGEPFTWRIGAGAALTLLGVLIIALRARAAHAAAPGAASAARTGRAAKAGAEPDG